MVSMSTWCRYFARKFEYAVTLSLKRYSTGQISDLEMRDSVWRNLFLGKMTFLHWNKGGVDMAPTIGEQGALLLVRKLPALSAYRVFAGDVVVVRDPEKPDNFMIRRLAATEGDEMVSTDKNEEPFILEEDQCWVLADNERLKPQEATDSRKFGPVPLTYIAGRVLYCLRSAVDHGPVQNSYYSMKKDAAVLEVELDVEEMAKHIKS